MLSDLKDLARVILGSATALLLYTDSKPTGNTWTHMQTICQLHSYVTDKWFACVFKVMQLYTECRLKTAISRKLKTPSISGRTVHLQTVLYTVHVNKKMFTLSLINHNATNFVPTQYSHVSISANRTTDSACKLLLNKNNGNWPIMAIFQAHLG